MSETKVISKQSTVFYYHPASQQWLQQAIARLTLLLNNSTNAYRIVAVDVEDSSRVVINSYLFAGLDYKTDNPIFHQWSDKRLLYGIKFESEEDASAFSGSMKAAISSISSGGNEVGHPPIPPRRQGSLSNLNEGGGNGSGVGGGGRGRGGRGSRGVRGGRGMRGRGGRGGVKPNIKVPGKAGGGAKPNIQKPNIQKPQAKLQKPKIPVPQKPQPREINNKQKETPAIAKPPKVVPRRTKTNVSNNIPKPISNERQHQSSGSLTNLPPPVVSGSNNNNVTNNNNNNNNNNNVKETSDKIKMSSSSSSSSSSSTKKKSRKKKKKTKTRSAAKPIPQARKYNVPKGHPFANPILTENSSILPQEAESEYQRLFNHSADSRIRLQITLKPRFVPTVESLKLILENYNQFFGNYPQDINSMRNLPANIKNGLILMQRYLNQEFIMICQLHWKDEENFRAIGSNFQVTEQSNPDVIAASIRKFYKENVINCFTINNYEPNKSFMELDNNNDKISWISDLVKSLPQKNREHVQALIYVLVQVLNADNKCDVQSIANIYGPCLFEPQLLHYHSPRSNPVNSNLVF